jgi:hypothetical protein
MANTYGTFTGNGSTATYAIPFTNWLNDSHVIVRVAGVNYDINSSGTSYDFTVSSGNVVFDANIANGVFFYILRDTLGIDHDDTALLYDFVDGSILTADQQDDVYQQAFFLAQENAESVPIYDSGWINQIDGEDIDEDISESEDIPAGVIAQHPFSRVNILARDETNPNDITEVPNFIEVAYNQSRIGASWAFDTSNNKLDFALAEYAGDWPFGFKTWGQDSNDVDQLRILIYR